MAWVYCKNGLRNDSKEVTGNENKEGKERKKGDLD